MPNIRHLGDVFIHVTDLPGAISWRSELTGIDERIGDPGSPTGYFQMEDGPGLALDRDRNNVSGIKPVCQLEVNDIESASRCQAHAVH